MKAVLILTFFALSILFLANVSALCNEGQININTASLDELDMLYGIGPVKAQSIIDSRPFNSVDDLLKVIGIGNATLSNIKAQGLACVENEESNDEKEDNEEKNKDVNKNNETKNEESVNNIIDNSNINSSDNYQQPQIEVIKLNQPANDTKDIKTEENSEFLNKDKIAMYGFFVFCVLIGILLIIRRKKIYKNDI